MNFPSLSAQALFAFLCVGTISGCKGPHKPIDIQNATDSTLSGLRIRHNGVLSEELTIKPKNWGEVKAVWDDRSPYELVRPGNGGYVVIGQCKVEHLWVDSLGIAVHSIDPPKVFCFEEG